jgi:hypothetical protein
MDAAFALAGPRTQEAKAALNSLGPSLHFLLSQRPTSPHVLHRHADTWLSVLHGINLRRQLILSDALAGAVEHCVVGGASGRDEVLIRVHHHHLSPTRHRDAGHGRTFGALSPEDQCCDTQISGGRETFDLVLASQAFQRMTGTKGDRIEALKNRPNTCAGGALCTFDSQSVESWMPCLSVRRRRSWQLEEASRMRPAWSCRDEALWTVSQA